MNDSPGWASPGSSPSDSERPGTDGSAQQPAPPAQPAQPAGDPKWSAEQPPPGQWSNPGTTPAAPQPQPQPTAGWGQQPGTPQAGQYGPQYGYPGAPGQWGQPPAAKPGVIPLRPLGLGEILDGAVATMRTHWRAVLPITLVVATVVQVISVIAQKFMLDDLAISASPDAGPEEFIDAIGSTIGATAVVQFIQFLGTIVVTAMLTMVFSRAVLGQHSSVSDAWRESRPQLLRLIGLTLLMALGAVLLGAVLILPGLLTETAALAVLGGVVWLPLLLWLGIKFTLASPALMLEKSTVFKAFARSSKLVKGTWWRIFGITLLTIIIAGFISAVIVMPFQFLGIFAFSGGLDALANGSAADMNNWGALIAPAIGLIIAQTIVMPFQSGVTVLLYVDQRIRREGLDLELARAAGLENYGTTGG
ncbi:glycerophosphoryl diester phosphodiesterase membrane domain-containing protein [Streptomyces sp. NBC_00853]|uniref:glycerophosphoryl diester phosphodiesterase membrane domain-containing protein n=1 Tax=unclassified Streptomyces TaxID=2593676 RepID=UPI0036C1A333|nr:glycerophosphoryl diester phosphodiesterase membrane domain-containing protein [Streptomyces sp. NBC_00853]